MPTPLLLLAIWASTRRQRSERGDVVGWMMMAILAVIVGGAMIIGMTGVGDSVIDRVKTALGV